MGYVGYTQGTDALKAIGIKPQFKLSGFNKKLTARVQAQWESRFSNPDVKLEVGTQHRFGNGVQLNANAVLQGSGEGFSSIGLNSYGFNATVRQGSQWWAHGEANFSGQGDLQNARLNGGFHLSDPNITATGDVRYRDGQGVDLGLSARYQVQDNLYMSGGARYDVSGGDVSGNLSVGYQPQDNMDVQLRGSVNQAGDALVGVGFTWRF